MHGHHPTHVLPRLLVQPCEVGGQGHALGNAHLIDDDATPTHDQLRTRVPGGLEGKLRLLVQAAAPVVQGHTYDGRLCGEAQGLREVLVRVVVVLPEHGYVA